MHRAVDATGRLHRPHTVTFDCWATLIHEVDGNRGPPARARALAKAAGVDERRAAEAIAAGWRKHQVLWHRRVVFAAPDITRDALETLGVTMPDDRFAELVQTMETQALSHEVRALPGAVSALERLARAGVRRALVCDTGYSPGRVVRTLLDRVGLLGLLEVTVFSDEVGFPKPDARAFAAALGPLGVSAEGAVHVGDIRRSDVAGARAAGMGTVRLTAHHDDADRPASPAKSGVIDCVAAGCAPVCERPEADRVAASYAELLSVLGYE